MYIVSHAEVMEQKAKKAAGEADRLRFDKIAAEIADELNKTTAPMIFEAMPTEKATEYPWCGSGWREIKIVSAVELAGFGPEMQAAPLTITIHRFPGSDSYQTAAQRGKYNICGSFDRSLHDHRRYNHPTHDIGVSHSKTAAQVAGEIVRRLLPGFLAEAATVYATRRATVAYLNERSAALSDLLGLLPRHAYLQGANRNGRNNNEEIYMPHSTETPVHGTVKYSPGRPNDGLNSSDAGMFEFLVDGLTKAQAEAIARILKGI